MYAYQLLIAFYSDVYVDSSRYMDTNQLIYLAPFFIIILSLVYLIRIKIFDRIFGIDLTELERENISPFSPFSDKEYQEIKDFKKDTPEEEIQEEYYAKL
ncbi:hypothetical protein [Salinimicrobium xinjiangense]|uniref:hypothetical protein n=1 Tax=Salinimicrobium xinjiangense TaxID=438596 RepID=UPI001FE22D7F|nr:hypothetical protein [Salinimicrobium xinjiangense]